MVFSEKDRRRNRELFRQMSAKEKWSHIWLYYKAVFLLAAVLVVILVSTIFSVATRKEPVLYVAYTNASIETDLEQVLWEDYLTSRNYDQKKVEIYINRDLYLSDFPEAEHYEYAHTSYMKVLALIECQELDLIVMNREAYDFCSTSGFLLELSALFPADDPRIVPYAASNLVILEDNGEEYSLGLAEEYVSVTDTRYNALKLPDLPWLREAGLSGELYLGIAANSPRPEACRDYILYLTEQ